MTLPSLTELATSIFGSPIVGEFELSQLKGFPKKRYDDQIELYTLLQEWYDGAPLKVTTQDKQTGKDVPQFPIQINPIKGTCQKHAATVIGQTVDSIRFGGLPFQIIPDLGEGKEEMTKKLKDALLKVLVDNAFGASFLSNCTTSQYLGGAVIAAKWLPVEKRVEVTTPSPKEFVGVPDGMNFWRLREAWIVREISKEDAEAMGYVPKQDEGKFFYIEHYTKSEYEIMINGKTILFEDGTPQSGENPFGVVPIVYVPHLRTTNFLGDSIITDTVKGLIKEINARWADVGDAVSDDSHGYVAVRNIPGNVQTINLGDGRPVLNLGSAIGIGGSQSDPDLFSVATKSASEPMLKLGGELFQMYRREVNHPAVADGEDEGSQRSSLTLAVRMAPLVSEAEMERINWSVGMVEFARILVIIMAEKGLDGITQDMIDVPYIVQWLSMLPRDREALATEAAMRANALLGSRKRLMELFGDIWNVEEEWKQIEDEKETVEPTPQPLNTGTGATASTNAQRSKKAAAAKGA